MSRWKQPLGCNVLEAAQARIAEVFEQFPRVYLSGPSGKDSGVMMHLACLEARRRGRKVGVLYVDLEAQYALTIESVREMFSERWPRAGMMLSGTAFALPTLERLIVESGCSSSRGDGWTTPKASDVERGDCPSERARRTPFLPSQVAPWPTPGAADGAKADESVESWERSAEACAARGVNRQFPLTIAAKMWPTPDASMGTGGRTGTRGASPTGLRPDGTKVQVTINAAVAASLRGSARPTPAARDWKDNGDFTVKSPEDRDGKGVPLAHAAGGSLNPDWVGRLMGFPDGWTSPHTDGQLPPAKRSAKASRHASRRSGGSDGRG